MTASRDKPLENVLERAINEIDGDTVTFGDVLDLFGDRSFGPIIVLLGLLVVVPPIGAVPGLPMIVGLVIILFTIQIIFGADRIWVPGFIEKRSISKEKLKAADKKTKPWLKRIDGLISQRITMLTGPWSVYASAVIVIFLALLMIPLELVPFAVAAPGAAITLYGLAIMARDGVLMLIGYVLAAITTAVTIAFVPWEKFASFFGMG
ncbi:exopolysaccharide biosynthesis protein [Henriciella algicola]|uniref:Exopolysaccharide biosynthesis protein n=1 Tax=Henriciella algicola TaxID=1608422 RepID=A0A399RDP8_9PROT|nr:exopolysaccharide biosynthesis protein [Henriciella algicola]RIJ29558.1 exopolysaccharide biosynthesis protein [Henriciella algicola]